MKAKRPPYQRILLKLSGEAFLPIGGKGKFGIEKEATQSIAAAIKEIHTKGVQVAIVVGGGNVFRGTQAEEFGFSRTPADQIGMLATAINGLVLSQALANLDCDCHVMSPFEMGSIVEKYNWQQALDYLEWGSILIFVGGTGSPYFSTDTAAALRASEIHADVVLKATKVDGIYDKDPLKYPKAKRLERLTYSEVLQKKLNVMDATAIALCRENNLPIHVFNLFKKGALLSAVYEKKGGSLVTGD